MLKKISLFLESNSRSRLDLPWFKKYRKNSAASIIHEIEFASHKTKHYLTSNLVVWPFFILISTLWTVLKYGKPLNQIKKLSTLAQIKQCYIICLKYNLAPIYFYKFRLWTGEESDIQNFIQPHELEIFHQKMLKGNYFNEINVKSDFHNYMKSQDIETADILMKVHNQTIEFLADEDSLENDLFIKYENLFGGIGSQKWCYECETKKWQFENYNFSRNELLEYLKERSIARSLIVQPVLTNHHSIKSLSTGAISTVRVVTGKLPNQYPVLLHHSCRFPTGLLNVDNFDAGGIACSLTNEGVIGKGISKKSGFMPIDTHPDSGLPLDGFQLPMYEKVKQLALTAHEKYKDAVTIGWDIVITENSVLILEANSKWCGELIQMPSGKPLIDKNNEDFYLSVLSSLFVLKE